MQLVLPQRVWPVLGQHSNLSVAGTFRALGETARPKGVAHRKGMPVLTLGGRHDQFRLRVRHC